MAKIGKAIPECLAFRHPNNVMDLAVETEFAYFGGNSTGLHWDIFRSLAINGSVQILFLTYLLKGGLKNLWLFNECVSMYILLLYSINGYSESSHIKLEFEAVKVAIYFDDRIKGADRIKAENAGKKQINLGSRKTIKHHLPRKNFAPKFYLLSNHQQSDHNINFTFYKSQSPLDTCLLCLIVFSCRSKRGEAERCSQKLDFYFSWKCLYWWLLGTLSRCPVSMPSTMNMLSIVLSAMTWPLNCVRVYDNTLRSYFKKMCDTLKTVNVVMSEVDSLSTISALFENPFWRIF